jgi:uncharacterized membrane protein
MGITAVTFALRLFGMQLEILFGVLHFLAVAILLFALLRRVLDKLPAWLQLMGFSALFIAARMVIPMLPHTRSLVLFIVGVPSTAWFTGIISRCCRGSAFLRRAASSVSSLRKTLCPAGFIRRG